MGECRLLMAIDRSDDEFFRDDMIIGIDDDG
jgi:hypothetical protein